jgi:hypothetical protein
MFQLSNPATAYDMLNGTDYRIKICAQLIESDFVTAHKLFAQLYYKYYSSDKPFVLRDAPNPTISSAIAGAFGILAPNIDYLESQVTLAICLFIAQNFSTWFRRIPELKSQAKLMHSTKKHCLTL